jgi:5-methyltetrahydropteroyltriglutamate--homocysteine methyltransferase
MTLFPTTLVGSFPQPEWLIDRSKLAGRFPPRVRARELWRIAEPYLAEALDDATTLAIQAQEQAGLDIITDGEIRRESYSNRFATALDGVDIDNPALRSIAAAIQIQCRAWSGRSAADMPSRSTTSAS